MLSRKTNLRLLVIVCVAGLALGLADVAWADHGPHGNFTPTTDACAGCHRAHTGGQGSLLIPASGVPGFGTIASMCLACHGSTGNGADSNVVDGVYTDRAGGGEGTVNAPLLAGGFVNYKGSPVTSSHYVGVYDYDNPDSAGRPQPTTYAWGSGPGEVTWQSETGCLGCHSDYFDLQWPDIPEWYPGPNIDEAGSNVMMPLSCTRCHDVHGNPNYRMLQQRLHPPHIDNADPQGLVLVKSFEPGGDTPDDPAIYQPDYTTPAYKLGLDDWCTGCHFLYNQQQSDPAWPFDAWDGAGKVIRYRHKMKTGITGVTSDSGVEYNLTTGLPLESDKLFCLTCHLAHGTSAAMDGFAQGVRPAEDSTLLRLDNRGVCEDCHKK